MLVAGDRQDNQVTLDELVSDRDEEEAIDVWRDVQGAACGQAHVTLAMSSWSELSHIYVCLLHRQRYPAADRIETGRVRGQRRG